MAVFTAIALGVAAAGAVYSGVQQRKQAKAQQKAIRAEQRRADIANARERRFAIRNARIAQASIQSQAASTGLTGSSSAAAAASNVQSRLGENLSFLDQNAQLSAQASAANEAAARYATRASYGQTVTNLATTAYRIYGGPKPQGTG